MDLELGLKITKTRDDIASISEYRLAKAGPVFQSRETNTAFILTAHLKGFKKNNINIKISEDGSKISVSGEKPVQNILMMGWLMHRKEVDVAGFNKVFKIPDGVKLDGIKAKYDEEEWIMNIIMPKLVKGICGVKIEEVKEEESDGRRSEQEKNEGDHIPSAVGETSQKGSKESEVQEMEESEYSMEKEEVSNKMLDDSNRKITKDTVHKEVEESKVGTDGENGDSFREVGKEEYEVKKTSEPEQKVGIGTSQEIGEASQKEIKELKLKNEDGRVKPSAKGKSVDEGMPKDIGGDTRQDKELKVQEMDGNEGFVEKEEKGASENMLDDAKANIIAEVIQKKEESKSGIKDRDGESVKENNVRAGHNGMKISEIEQNVGADVTQNIGDKIQRVSKDSVIEQMGENKSIEENKEREEPEEMVVEANVSTEGETLGESNQKQFGEPSSETEDRLNESLKENRMETMKAPQLDQNVDDQIPTNIGGISQERYKESRIQWKKKTNSIKENVDEGKSEKIPIQASKNGKKHIYGKSMLENIKKPKIQAGNEDHVLPKIETGNGDQVYNDGVKAGKEEFDLMETKGEFPQKLPKGTTEESKRLSVSKMQETEDVKEAKIKTKWKENEYLVDKDEGEELRRMHKQAKKDLAKNTLQENEDVKEAMDKRERKEIEYFVDKSAGEEHKRRHMEAKKDLTKETMKKNEATMDKREDKEIEYIVEASKDLKTNKIQEIEDIQEEMSKRKDQGIEKFEDKGERKEHNRLYMEAKDFKKETIQENEDTHEAMLKREGKNNEHFGDKRGENPERMHMESKKNIAKERMQETYDVKEATIKRKGEEIGNFTDKGGEEPTKIITHAKKELTKETEQENEKVNEAMLKTKDKEIERFVDKGEPKSMNVEPKKGLTAKTMQESENVREAMVKAEGNGYKYFVNKGVSEEPERMHIEPKKDMAKEKLQEGSKEAMVKIKGKEIENFVVKDGGEENKKMNMKLKKESTKETKQGSENVKEAMGKMKGNETKYFVDKGEGEKPKSMNVEAKKEDDRECKDCECFVDKGEGEETKRMLMEQKNVAKETMQEIKSVKEAMIKRKGKEIENLADKDEAGELTKMLAKSNKELTKEKRQQSEKTKEAMVKRKGKETGYFADKGEDKEPKSMYVEEKNLTTKTTQESEEPKRMHIKPKGITKDTIPKTGVKEAKVKTKDKEIGNFVDKYDGEEHIKMLVKELPKERDKEREKFKEVMVQKKVKETEYSMDKGEDEEPINMHVEAEKDLTSNTILESEDVREEVVETEGKDYKYFVDKGESEELKMTNMEAKKNTGRESMQETKGAKEAMAKRKGKEIGSFEKGEDKETKKVHVEDKKDLTTVTVQESDGDDEGNENKCFSDEGEDEEPNRMYMETKKDFREETLHESENVKNVKVKSEGKDIECFADKSAEKESIRMLMETKRDLTKEEMHENDDVKETMIKRKGKEIEYFVDNSEGEVEEPKRMHIEEKKDLATKTMHEIEDANEVMLKSKDKDIENFGKESKIRETKKDSTKVTMNESDDTREAIVKRKGKEVECFVGKGEEPKWMPTEAQKDLTSKTREESEVIREAMVKREGEEEMDYFLEKREDEKDIPKEKIQIVEKIKHGITDNDQGNVLGKTTKGKSEVPTEEGPKLVGGQDGSRGLKVSNMEDPKEIIKEEMAETENLMEKVQGQKSKKGEEARRVVQKNTATEILQKETEESNNERKSREGPNVPNNMVKVVFEVLGTFQAKLPKKMMEAIGQNKDKNEYVTVKLKAEGSIKMHVEPNEAFDEDETEERSEKEVRKPELKSTDQISGKDNVDFGVFDGRKRPKFLEMGETQGAKEDNAQMEESAKKINGDQSEKIQVEEKGRKSSQKGREGPKIQTLVKDQNRLQEEKEKPLGKTTAEDKKPKMEEITPEFEKASGFKRAVENSHESSKREHQIITPKKEVEKSKKEENSPMPTASQRKEPRELSLPSKDYKSSKIEEVQQKEGKRTMHLLEGTTSKEGELAQAIATHSKAKSEIDELQVNQLPSPSTEMWSTEAHESEKYGLKEDGSKAVTLDHMQEGKEFIHSIDSTASSEVVAGETAETSKFSSSSSTQPFEVEGKDKINASCDDESQDSDTDSEIDGETSNQGETDEEVVQRETPQPESPEDQQYTHKALEESNGTHEIEEEKTDEQGDESDQEDSEELDDQKECEEEAIGGKKDQKRSKKLIISTIIAGSALLASGIFLVIRHRRSIKGAK